MSVCHDDAANGQDRLPLIVLREGAFAPEGRKAVFDRCNRGFVQGERRTDGGSDGVFG